MLKCEERIEKAALDESRLAHPLDDEGIVLKENVLVNPGMVNILPSASLRYKKGARIAFKRP